MIKKILFAILLCGTSAAAQPKEPIRASFFAGRALPTPPQQKAPWPHGEDMLSKAVVTLFDQGWPDPRGLEYREIEIAVGNPWNGGGKVLKTHGWLLPESNDGGRFAIAWNALVYPVVNVGAAIDLRQDWGPDSPLASAQDWDFEDASEPLAAKYDSPRTLKVVILLRLGEVETVQRVAQLKLLEKQGDPYLSLATDWTWSAFERAVCAHERGDDQLALMDARMLTKIQPLIEAEAARRGFRPDTNYSNSRSADHKPSYLPLLQQLPTLLADCERRVAQQGDPLQVPPGRAVQDIAALIEDLQNVNARQMGQPGGVSLAGDPRVQALVNRGNEVVEPLLDVVENDTRLTRSVSFHRDFFRGRHLISVSEAAYAALVDLLRVQFKTYDENGQPLSKKELVTQMRAYWAKMGSLSPMERFYLTLKDDKAGHDQWLQAAANLVQPTDVESHGGWISVPTRKPGQAILLRGEILRDGRTPSVAQLLAKRSDDMAAIRTNSTQDHFLYLDSGQMALNLAAWDKAAALPILKKRLMRAWNIGAQPDDMLAFNGSPVERFGGLIAKMTLARVQCGDATAYDEYAAWIQKAKLEDVFSVANDLQQPLIQGMGRPSIGRAIQYLFNDPKSPWSNILGERNGSWLTDFWQTPLPKTQGFLPQALRGLADKNPAGTITFNPRSQWNSRTEAQIELKGLGMGFSGSKEDPDTPPPSQKRPFRVCDVYAYFYSQYQLGPQFQLFWPEKKRDEGVSACRQWLSSKK